jgi:hypothetical protein
MHCTRKIIFSKKRERKFITILCQCVIRERERERDLSDQSNNFMVVFYDHHDQLPPSLLPFHYEL